jgi:hypothetical protein
MDHRQTRYEEIFLRKRSGFSWILHTLTSVPLFHEYQIVQNWELADPQGRRGSTNNNISGGWGKCFLRPTLKPGYGPKYAFIFKFYFDIMTRGIE